MDIATKTAVLLGVVLLLGSGIARRAFAPSPNPHERRLLLAAALLGALLVVAGSLGEVAAVVTRILRGRFDLALFGDYLLSTRHGQAVVVRCVAALPLALWAARPVLSGRADRVGFGAAGLAFLATISLVSHSGTMGVAGFLSDLAHLSATVAWSGALLGLAVLPVWTPGPSLRSHVRAVSRVGLASVVVLATTGTYMSTLHMYGVEAVTESAYGRALTLKLGLVAVVLVLAAANRWLFVPLLERFDRSAPLRRSVRVETALLALVLVATAVLATREPAHAPPTPPPTPAASDPAEPPAGQGHGHEHAPRQVPAPPGHDAH